MLSKVTPPVSARAWDHTIRAGHQWFLLRGTWSSLLRRQRKHRITNYCCYEPQQGFCLIKYEASGFGFPSKSQTLAAKPNARTDVALQVSVSPSVRGIFLLLCLRKRGKSANTTQGHTAPPFQCEKLEADICKTTFGGPR